MIMEKCLCKHSSAKGKNNKLLLNLEKQRKAKVEALQTQIEKLEREHEETMKQETKMEMNKIKNEMNEI